MCPRCFLMPACPCRRGGARLLAAGRQGDRRCAEAPQTEATCLSSHDRRRAEMAPATPDPNTHRGVSMPLVRYTLVTAVVAALLLPTVTTAKGDHSKGAGESRQVERLRQIEQKRLQALVDADVDAAGSLIADDYEGINPLGEILTRNVFLGAVGSGAIDFLSDEVTSPI